MIRTDFRAARSAHRHGFTFIEIMLVVVIIGILSAMVGPRLLDILDDANINSTKNQMKSIQTALELFYVRVNRFPTTDEGLQALVTCPSGLDEERWQNKMMPQMPKDAWGFDFVYNSPGSEGDDYDLYSVGPDGEEGTEDDVNSVISEEE